MGNVVFVNFVLLKGFGFSKITCDFLCLVDARNYRLPKFDILVYWQYEEMQGWIRYPAAARGVSARSAFLIQCIHSRKYKMFHCEPMVEWPIDEYVLSEIF